MPIASQGVVNSWIVGMWSVKAVGMWSVRGRYVVDMWSVCGRYADDDCLLVGEITGQFLGK